MDSKVYKKQVLTSMLLFLRLETSLKHYCSKDNRSSHAVNLINNCRNSKINLPFNQLKKKEKS